MAAVMDEIVDPMLAMESPLTVDNSVEYVRQDFDLQAHNWTQSGVLLECSGACLIGSPHGHRVGSNQQIIKDEKGAYSLVDLF